MVEQILLGHIESPKDTSCVQTVSSEVANIGSSKALLMAFWERFWPPKIDEPRVAMKMNSQ